MKVDGITLLQMIKENKLKDKTIVRRAHDTYPFVSTEYDYDYYIYFCSDREFHRCDKNGKLGARYQSRFLNYDVIEKEFEIIEEIEKLKEIEPLEKIDVHYSNPLNLMSYVKKEYDCTKENICDKLNEVIEKVNYLSKKEDD